MESNGFALVPLIGVKSKLSLQSNLNVSHRRKPLSPSSLLQKNNLKLTLETHEITDAGIVGKTQSAGGSLDQVAPVEGIDR